jgi:tRNA(fMet)-specific endonuclease VapC
LDKALLDTDIFSELQKGINQRVVTRATTYRNAFGCYTISVITVTEIVKGWHKRQRENGIQQFLAAISL